VGNTLQKILQGRGGKKRQGSRIILCFPGLLLFLTYLGLLLEFPIEGQRQSLWFIFCFATIAINFIFIIKKEKNSPVEFFLSFALLIAGSAQAFPMTWLRLAYFPFFTSLTAFYGPKTVLSVLLFVPFFELGNVLRGKPFAGEAALMMFLVITVGLSLFLKKRVERGLRNDTIKEKEADEIAYDESELKAASDEKIMSHYLELMFSPDEEIREVLAVAKNAMFADSVNLFMSVDGVLRLRCSSEEQAGIIPSNSGLLHLCFEERKPFISSDINQGRQEAGYLKKDKIISLIAVPVVDVNFPLGVISADSARVHAFSNADCDTLMMFSKQITRALQRERVYPQAQRSFETLKILNEESSKLLSSLKEDVIVQNLIEGAYRIIPTEIMFFGVKGRDVEILQGKDLSPREKKIFNAKGTVLDMAANDKEHIYISDVRNYRIPVMPFKTDNVNSVFLLPMFYERNLLGILVLLLEKTNALSTYQIEILKVLGNQASTSIANARFHEKIKLLAITDGLTGLFNHKNFQERLTQEFDRFGRFSEPISLLLIDIDFFKKINDTYGHPVGDLVLKRVAGIIQKTVRNIDIPARYGGEEFAVVLVGTDEKGAMNMAERLRKTIMDKKFTADQSTFNVTVSVGISTTAGESVKKEALIERADKALYKAKGDGRNQCVLWRGGEGN
jgi:diguanylate cyclase (GGDEF)-like protein